MASSPEEKFRAAVKVIQTLPKNGSFQPSNELMLKFYAYFKQANIGPTNIPKPGFWDIVGRAKWDAWNKLGEMPQEEAMLLYVEELKQAFRDANVDAYIVDGKLQNLPEAEIIEAMPHTQMVSDFVEKLGSFYEIVEDGDVTKSKLALLNGQMSNSFGNKNSTEKSHGGDVSDQGSEDEQEAETARHSSNTSNGDAVAMETYRIPVKGLPANVPKDIPNHAQKHAPLQNGHSPGESHRYAAGRADSPSDSDGEEFCDSSDLPQAKKGKKKKTPPLRSTHANHRHQMPEEEECIVATEAYGQFSSAFQPVMSLHQTDGELQTASSTQVYSQMEGVNNNEYKASNNPSIPTDMLPTDAIVMCGGGSDFPGNGGRQQQRTNPSQQANNPQTRGGARGRDGSGSGGMQASGGAGGGDRNPSFGVMSNSAVNEQIAIALVRLQQDMNNVLSRLNTLEALTVAQHQVSRSRNSSESERHERQSRLAGPWWWPFSNLSGQTVAIFLLWPLIVHWVLVIIKKRRERLRR